MESVQKGTVPERPGPERPGPERPTIKSKMTPTVIVCGVGFERISGVHFQ